MKKVILVVEQDETIRKLYTEVFGKEDFDVVAVDVLTDGLEILRSNSKVSAMILDFHLLEDLGLQTIQEIKSINSGVALLLTGVVSTDRLMECIKFGIDDYIEKPFLDLEILKNSLDLLLDKQESSTDLQDESTHFATETNRLVGQSKPILKLKRLIHKVAPLDSTVLILGDTGTGKEVVARMIHSLSPQKHHNFIAVHCGGIPDTLLESTLFGHEKGAFTGAYRTHKGYFEHANDGTIFLDEIGDTTQPFQVKLLRVLQDKQFRRVGGTETLTTNARILAATNRDLTKSVESGEFREDLYYRLNVITLTVPALRERMDDIPLLIRYFMHIYCKKYNRLGIYLKPETIHLLEKQSWNGNVRELENIIERLVALTDSDWIGPSELPEEYLRGQQFDFLNKSPFLSFGKAKTLFEKEYISLLLKKTDGNISKAAELAGMPRQNLHLKIKKHSLNARDEVE